MAAKSILLSEAKAGMKIANNIMDSNGHLVMKEGTALTNVDIENLENYGIIVVKISEESEIDDIFRENVDTPEIKETFSDSYHTKIESTEEFKKFDETFNKAVDSIEVEFNDIVFKSKEIKVDSLIDTVFEVVKSNKTNYSMMEVLSCMRGYDDMTFVHCMNVSLICNIMAKWLGYSNSDTELLTAAGLLHDIGKVRIPANIIKKPGKLTDQEYSIIKCHTVYGYEILKDQPLNMKIKNAALQHHERFDGRGYPRSLKADEIDEISKIVAVADVYDAMTAKRVYKDKMSPFDVIEFFEKYKSEFDPYILLTFLNKTAETYIGSTVQLSNGEYGKVAMINKNDLGRPVVITDSGAIDLSKKNDVKILGLI